MSCGTAYIEEVLEAVNIVNRYHNKLILMYCRSSYPLKEKNSNLSTINFLSKKFPKNIIGYSDHTNSSNTSRVACILGAKIIEKHFIVDDKKTYDSDFSIKPNEFKKLKKEIINDFKIIGYKKPYILMDEKIRRKYRRSIYAIKNIRAGEKFTEKNITTLRPKIGLCSSKYFQIINKFSKRL